MVERWERVWTRTAICEVARCTYPRSLQANEQLGAHKWPSGKMNGQRTDDSWWTQVGIFNRQLTAYSAEASPKAIFVGLHYMNEHSFYGRR